MAKPGSSWWSDKPSTSWKKAVVSSNASVRVPSQHSRLTFTSSSSLRRDVGGGEAAVHDEGRPVHERRLVGREEERGIDDLARLAETPCGPVHLATGKRSRVVAEDREEERRLDRAWAEGVHADPLTRELHAELLAHREHGPLRRRVRDLRGRRAQDGDEGSDVDHRPSSPLEQVRDPVLAAEEDALRVHVLNALPCLDARIEYRSVVAR